MATSTVGTGRTYSTLSAWESAVGGDITGTGIEIADCYGGADLGKVNVSGWTTDASNYPVIRAASGEKHNGTFDTNKAKVENDHNAQGIRADANHLRIEGLQFRNTHTASFGNLYAIEVTPGTLAYIDDCLIDMNSDAWNGDNNYTACILGGVDRTADLVIRNCVMFNHVVPSATLGALSAVYTLNHNSGLTYVYNCTFANVDRAVRDGFSETIVRNCIAGDLSGNIEAFTGPFNSASDYNYSEDSTDTGGTNDTTAGSISFANAGSEDYSLAADIAGEDLSAVTYGFTNDILGTTRSAWSAGAFEFGADEPTHKVQADPGAYSAEHDATCLTYPSAGGTSSRTLSAELARYRIDVGEWSLDETTGGGTSTERVAPNSIELQTGLTGAITDIDDDPDSPDANWLTANASSPILEVAFATPSANPATGAGLQEIRIQVRKDAAGGGTPQIQDAYIRETGSATNLATLVDPGAPVDVTSSTGTVLSWTWDASVLGTADGSAVEIHIDTAKGGGGPNERNVEIGAIEWNAEVAGSSTTTEQHGVAAGVGDYAVAVTPATLTSPVPTLTHCILGADVGRYVVDSVGALVEPPTGATLLAAGLGTYAVAGIAATLERALLLDAALGTYAVAGQAATLAKARRLTAELGTYAVAGQTAELTRALRLGAGAESYAVAGTDAALERALRLDAGLGTYATTGQDAGLTLSQRLDAAAGSYAVAGTDATLRRDLLLGAELDTYAVAGQDATLTYAGTTTLVADAGAYTVAGTDAALTRSRRLSAELGAYAVAGTDAALERALVLAAELQSYALAGTDAGLLQAHRLDAELAAYTATGTDAGLRVSFRLGADTGAVAVSGVAAGLRRALRLAADSRAYDTLGTAAALTRALRLSGDAGVVAVSGTDATFDRALAAELGTYALAGTAASLERDLLLGADAGAFTVTGEDAGVTTAARIGADAGTYAVAVADAALLQARRLTAELGAYTATGVDAELERSLVLTATTEAYAIAGTAAELLQTHRLTAELDTYAVAGQDAALQYGASTTLTAETGAYAVAGIAAGTLRDRLFVAESDAYAVAGQAATLARALRVSAEPGAVAVNGADAGLLLDRALAAAADAVSVAGQAAELTRSLRLGAVAGTVSIAGAVATLTRALKLDGGLGAFTVAGTDAGLSYGSQTTLIAETGAYVATGANAALLRSLAVAADPGAYAVAGTAAALERALLLGAELGAYDVTGTDSGLTYLGAYVVPTANRAAAARLARFVDAIGRETAVAAAHRTTEIDA